LGVGRDRNTFPVGAWLNSTRLRASASMVHHRYDPGRSGWDARLTMETASRHSTARVDEGAEPGGISASSGRQRQTLVHLRMGAEVWLGRAFSLAASGIFHEVQSDEDVLPYSEHYRLGGAATLRGYREDQFHGQRIAAGTLEFRIGRADGSRLYSFLDIGYFSFNEALETTTESPQIREISDTLRGFGLGLETETIAGRISLAIGFPGSFIFDEAKLHVKHRQTF
jgi:hemolysin activation/secretion protein